MKQHPLQLRITRQSRKGFTLIELLVVIAIIALLAAILFPVFARARENARKSSCANNLKQMALGVIQYSQDYDEQYPQAWSAGSAVCWWEAIYPYTKSWQMYSCPSDSNKATNNFPAATTSRWPISYGINFRVCGNGQYSSTIGNQADFSKPSTTVLFSDLGKNANTALTAPYLTNTVKANTWLLVDPTCFNSNTTGNTKPCNDGGAVSTPTAGGGPRNSGDFNWAGPNDRHLETSNLAFLDGHVKAMKPGSWYVANSTFLSGL